MKRLRVEDRDRYDAEGGRKHRCHEEVFGGRSGRMPERDGDGCDQSQGGAGLESPVGYHP